MGSGVLIRWCFHSFSVGFDVTLEQGFSTGLIQSDKKLTLRPSVMKIQISYIIKWIQLKYNQT